MHSCRCIGWFSLALLFLGWWPSSALSADKSEVLLDKAAKDYVLHGSIQASEGRDEEAIKSFSEAIKLKPQWAEAYSLLGSALARAGKLTEAEAALRKAVALKPDYSEGYYYLGLFLKERGREKEAQEAFAKAKQYQQSSSSPAGR